MSSPDPEPAPDARVEAAKASFAARAEELNRRLRGVRARLADARRRLDVRARIETHPLTAVGFAAVTGAVLGGLGRRPPARPSTGPRTTGSVVVGALGAIAMAIVKDYALTKASAAARRWYARRSDLEHAPD